MVNDLEVELAEMKGFTRALALFSILSWLTIVLVIGFMLWEVNSIPNKDASAVTAVLANYNVINFQK